VISRMLFDQYFTNCYSVHSLFTKSSEIFFQETITEHILSVCVVCSLSIKSY